MVFPVQDDTAQAMAAAGLVPGLSPSPVLLPGRIFQKRAERLKFLAPGHSLEAWLRFIATLSEAQQVVLDAPVSGTLLPESRWQADLQSLLAHLGTNTPETVQEVLRALGSADNKSLDAMAGRILGGELQRGDLAPAPFIAAALQVAWTRHAASQDAAAIGAPATASSCPVCGCAPVCGVIEDDRGGLRYLHCGLCHTAWHHVRATCVACGESKEVSYRTIEGDKTGAGAEACDACHSYLKLLRGDKSPGLNPVADDLASLAVDLLLNEDGYRRIGINPFMMLEG